MTTADAKAGLVRAYSSGEKPRFLRTLPGGGDEVWALADMLLVIPVVPADAPPDLEYALRLRRDALIGGRCPDCGAVPTLDSIPVPLPIPTAAALFNHRPTCAGSDLNAKGLLAKHKKRSWQQALDAKIHLMNAKSRERIAEIQDRGIEMDAPDAQQVALDLLAGLMEQDALESCPHLADDPLQVWNVLIAEGAWRCDQCWAYFLDHIRSGFQLDPIEELTCDLCRRYAPTSIWPLVLRIDNFVMRGAACRACGKAYASAMEAE